MNAKQNSICNWTWILNKHIYIYIYIYIFASLVVNHHMRPNSNCTNSLLSKAGRMLHDLVAKCQQEHTYSSPLLFMLALLYQITSFEPGRTVPLLRFPSIMPFSVRTIWQIHETYNTYILNRWHIALEYCRHRINVVGSKLKLFAGGPDCEWNLRNIKNKSMFAQRMKCVEDDRWIGLGS